MSFIIVLLSNNISIKNKTIHQTHNIKIIILLLQFLKRWSFIFFLVLDADSYRVKIINEQIQVQREQAYQLISGATEYPTADLRLQHC